MATTRLTATVCTAVFTDTVADVVESKLKSIGSGMGTRSKSNTTTDPVDDTAAGFWEFDSIDPQASS